jgi:phospholipid N-methyltransferase
MNSESINKRSTRILDVGSSDGTLIRCLVNKLVKRRCNNIEATAIEPDEESFLHHEEEHIKPTNAPNDYIIDWKNLSLKDYLSTKHLKIEKYDLILCSHVFYHFQPSDWNKIISTLQTKLRKYGKLIVILDAYDSPIYNFKGQIMPLFSDNNILDSFGGEISAELFKSFIERKGFQYRRSTLDSNVIVPKNSNFASLLRILTFLFRHDLFTSEKIIQRLFEWVMTYKHKGDGEYYIFPWKEILFAFESNENSNYT